jgi:hypothetical protein
MDRKGEEEQSSVELLKRTLYKRNKEPELRQRRELDEIKYEVPEGWTGEQSAPPTTDEEPQPAQPEDPQEVLEQLARGEIPSEEPQPHPQANDMTPAQAASLRRRRIVKTIIWSIFGLSLVFFLVTLGIAGYYFVGGENQVTCANLDIQVSGPQTIASGKELNLQIELINKNTVPIRNTVLELEYPEGARSAQDASFGLPTSREQIGTIETQERVRSAAQVILFGQEQTEQLITARVTHGIDDSNATFSCEVPYRVLISTAPVTLTVEGLEEISSGQELELTVHIRSNSEEVVPELRLVVDYPFGFEFLSASPEPSDEEVENVWEIGDLAPGTELELILRGIVRGQGTEGRQMSFEIGARNPADAEGLDTILQAAKHPILISRPFLALDVELNDSSAPEVVSELGERNNGVLTWRNTLPYAIYDVEIDAVFNSSMLDTSNVLAPQGYFRSIDKTITWTPQTHPDLRTVEAGEDGELYFTFATRDYQPGTSATDPSMSIAFNVRARRVSDDVEVQQTLQAQAGRVVRFNSNIELFPYLLYRTGPFTNSGPYPPRANERTTYTVMWEVSNTTNDVDDAQVTATLPIYVRWLNRITPIDENVSYNPVTREIVWVLGTVPHSTGYEEDTRTLSFQVEFLPSETQVKEEPHIVLDHYLQGVDRYTGSVLQRDMRSLSSRLYEDAYFSDVTGVVQP